MRRRSTKPSQKPVVESSNPPPPPDFQTGRVEIALDQGSPEGVVDATELIVSPGFVDAHTHMDAQIFWDPIGTCSCEHGVTSVVMGNCGFTLAPVNVEDVGLVLENLEEAEAIPADVLAAGVEFRWKTFPEYIETLESLPKGINYAG